MPMRPWRTMLGSKLFELGERGSGLARLEPLAPTLPLNEHSTGS